MTSSLFFFFLFEEQEAERGGNQELTLPSKASGPLLLARALLLKVQAPLNITGNKRSNLNPWEISEMSPEATES